MDDFHTTCPDDDEIESAYYSISGNHFRRTDLVALEEMRSLGADDGLILRVMENTGRRGYRDIGSMRYFLPIVRRALLEERSDDSLPPRRNSADHSGWMPETSDPADVENALDEEWRALTLRYEETPDDNVYDDGDFYDKYLRNSSGREEQW